MEASVAYKADLMKAGTVVSSFAFEVTSPDDFAIRAREAYEFFRRETNISLFDDDVTVVFGKA